MTVPQTFVIKNYEENAKEALVVFLALAFLSIIALAWDLLSSNASGGIIVFGISTLFWASFALYTHCWLKAGPYSVAADEDGLWLAHLSKDTGLVRWQDIATIRGRPYLQRLDLLGDGGNVLLTLDYLLTPFSQLLSLVMEKASGQVEIPSLPITAAKSPIYHLLYALSFVGFGALGWRIYCQHGGNWFVYVLLTGFVYVLVVLYLTTISRVTIDRKFLLIAYPLVQRTYPWTDIDSVQLSDVRAANEGRYIQLNVTAKGCEEPFQLDGLGMDTFALHRLIMAAWKDEPNAPPTIKVRSRSRSEPQSEPFI